MNGHPNDTCYNEIGLRTQNILKQQSKFKIVVHTIGRAYVLT